METSLQFEPNTSGPAFSSARLRVVESELGVELPHDFLEVLRAANGGIPSARHLSISGNERQIDRFLSIFDDYKNHPLGIYDIEVVWSQIEDRLGESLVPFAALSNGDFLCFSYGPEERTPSVVLWDHECSLADEPSVQPVARSFSDLLKKLHQ